MRIACVGHRIYFENHFCETSSTRNQVRWIDFDHFSTSFYDEIRAFRPDVTLIYRPELHSRSFLQSLGGLKIGFSTEPIPKILNGGVRETEETDRRLSVLKNIQFDSFDAVYHYDEASRTYCEKAKLNFAAYRTIPINTDYFFPRRRQKYCWDAIFVGKATERRIQCLRGLKSHNRPFLWIEHGVSGNALAKLFARARCVLNIHADDLPALEPRIYLAASVGVPVISDFIGTADFPFSRHVRELDMAKLSFDVIDNVIAEVEDSGVFSDLSYQESQMRGSSVLEFIGDAIDRILRYR